MLTNLSINNFRGLKGLEINPLGRINLLAGKNGAGKTSVLEAFWIFSAPDIPELTTRISAFRGLHPPSAETVFVDLFNDFDPHKSIEIAASATPGRKRRTLTISLEERSSTIARSWPSVSPSEPNLERSTQFLTEGQFQIILDYLHDDGRNYTSRGWWVEQVVTPMAPVPVPVELTNAGIHQEMERVPGRPDSLFMAAPFRENLQADAQRFGNLQLQGKDGEILSILRTVEPRLNSIAPILIKNTPIIHANIGMDRPIAVRLLGGGFSRIFSISVAMEGARGGMLLIDEIENGLHHRVLKDIFSNLLSLANKFDVQVVATTHSAECIEAAFHALGNGDEGDFTFHRIDQREGHSKAVYYDHGMLETAIEFDMEVR